MPAYTPNNEKQATMKRRRDIAILLVLISNVSAFVPNFLYPRTFMMKSANSESMSSSSTNVFSNFATISRVEVKNQGHDTVKTEREELAGGKRNHPAKKSKPKPRKNSKKLKEFQWLNWVYNHWRSTKPGELTEETLKQMVPAISTWGRRKTDYAAKRSEELLDRIIDENLAGNSHAELTVNLFNAAMDAYAKVGNHVKVQKILRRMNNLSTNHDHLKHLKPDNFSMSILATAWAKSRSPEAALKAEAILNYMETQNLAPNTVTYNAVLHAVALGDQIDKAVRAEDLVKRMKNRYSEGEGCKPDIYSYQSLIQAWSKTLLPGSPQRAEKILHWLDSEADKGDKSLAPNAHCFTSTIHAWARSGERNRARSAYQILDHMTKRYLESRNPNLKPNVKTFTAVLNACARPVDESERNDAFEIAETTMAELSQGTYDKPNFLSYAAFLSVCCSTVAPGEERDVIVRKKFKECIEAGEVAKLVLTKLRIAATPSLYEELVGKYKQDDGSLQIPQGWKASIKGERSEAEDVTNTHAKHRIPRSSYLRLEAVQKSCGQSGFYSGNAPARPEGVTWSQRPLGADQ